MIGDFNSRVGPKSDCVPHDKYVAGIDDVNYTPDTHIPKSSTDTTTNNFGIQLLDMCVASGLRIANGRFSGDRDGKSTFCNRNGKSVIDYLLVQGNNFEKISHFSIHDFTEFSDHTPVSFTVLCSPTPPVQSNHSTRHTSVKSVILH